MKTKTDNSGVAQKAALRKFLVDEAGGPARCRVLETHCGFGTMTDACYGGVADWVGVDKKPEARGITADSRKILRATELSRFNFFDVDPHGNPYEYLWLISKHLAQPAGTRVALAVTSGVQGGVAARAPTMRVQSKQVVSDIGLNLGSYNRYICHRHADQFAQRLVLAWFGGKWAIHNWASARPAHGRVYYFGVVLDALTC